LSILELSECEVGKLITHATIMGKLIPETSEDYMKLVRLAWGFRRVVNLMVREVVNGTLMKDATKKLHHILPNYIYLESAYKHAKLIADGCKFNKGSPKHVHVKKLFIISRDNKWERGNRKIKLIPREEYFEVLVKYPWDSSWIKAEALFGRKYIPMLKELIELCERREEGYCARITFKTKD